MSTTPVEFLDYHPDEPQAWLWRSRWWHSTPVFLSHLLGFLIQGEDGWRRESGNHMGWRWGDRLVDARWPCVKDRSVWDAERDNAIIHAFAFNPALSLEQKQTLARYIAQQVGKPYDTLLFSKRALHTAGRLVRFIAGLRHRARKVEDRLGELAFICYELIARGVNELQIEGLALDPAAFGPLRLWEASRQGLLCYRGVVDFRRPEERGSLAVEALTSIVNAYRRRS